jgi:hypothetical protein
MHQNYIYLRHNKRAHNLKSAHLAIMFYSAQGSNSQSM